MTILEASIKLFDWFKTNNSFSIDDAENLIALGIETKEQIAAAIISLDRLEKLEIIKGTEAVIKNKVNKIYVLEKPVQNFSQTVSISGMTASGISRCINLFCEEIKDDTDLCNPLSITEKDISNLVLLVEYYSSKCPKKTSPNTPFENN